MQGGRPVGCGAMGFSNKEQTMNKTISSNRGVAALVVSAATLLLAGALCFVVGCSPQQAAQSDEAQPVEDPMANQVVEWSQDIDCMTCHTEESATMTDTSIAQASMHNDEGMACIDCHTEADVLSEVHEGVTYGSTVPTKATVVSVNPETCQTAECHGTMEDMAKLTEGAVTLVDSNGNEVNPHAYDSNEQHDAHVPTCTDCHKVHSADTQKDATKWCAQCHHRGVFTCGNCHELRERPVS